MHVVGKKEKKQECFCHIALYNQESTKINSMLLLGKNVTKKNKLPSVELKYSSDMKNFY